MNRKAKGNKLIWLLSVAMFAVVAFALLFSTYYMNLSVTAEEDAQTRKSQYRQLGEQLAEASDYLTEQVRYYAITGDIEHLYNYWEEIYVTRRREKAIEAFELSNPPIEEKELLEQAKKYSDLLVETETCSMKLVLISQGMTNDDYRENDKLAEYVSHVLKYDMPSEMTQMSEMQMRESAIDILYDNNYESYKTMIMTPIEEFTSMMNTRLDSEVEVKKAGTRVATVIQIVISIASLLAIVILLRLMNKFYEAEHANQAKSIFLAQMSHELRTPLNAVNGYTYLLEQTQLTPKQSEYLQSIRYSSNGLLELINQILDFSKIEAGFLELDNKEFSLRELLHEIEALFAQQASEKKLNFEVMIQDDVPDWIEGDPLRLRQVLVNLLGNAFKFTNEGAVAVRVCLLRKNDEKCVIHFAVDDTGIGVEKAVRRKIFEPFMQQDASVSRKYGGTGLGLAISSQIVLLSGDGSHRLKLESEPGNGSTFSFSMDYPYLSEDRVEDLKKKESLNENNNEIPDLHGCKVLLTDDSEINIRVQSEILKLCNMEVLTALSGEQALEILKREKNVQLIFMDIRMPGMDGYETAERIRKLDNYKDTPIIALTADAVPEVQIRLKDAGMNGCLLKPIEQNALYAVMRKYLKEDIRTVNTVENSKCAVFDEKACLRHLNGNTNAMLEIIHRFLLLHDRDDELLEQYIIDGDYHRAEELVHQLKGIAGNIKCEKLYKCCAALQCSLHEQEHKGIDEFYTIWNVTIKKLREKKCKTGGGICLGAKDEADATKQLDGSILNELALMCDMNDTDVIIRLEEIMKNDVQLRILEKALSDEDMSNLKKATYIYDFSQIKSVLLKASGVLREGVDQHV